MSAADFRRCVNCTRVRPVADLFLHAQEKVWYCQDFARCEQRLRVLWLRRDSAVLNRPDLGSVTWP